MRDTQFLGIGVGLRAPHIPHLLSESTRLGWLEAISENFMGLPQLKGGGSPLNTLKKIREKYPIALHGVSMNLGSVDEHDLHYLKRLKSLTQTIEPLWVSDHLCWTGVNGENLHDLMPLPYTNEALDHVSDKIQFAQDYLSRNLVIENVSAYITYPESEMPEWEFLNELCKRTGCELLLDVNNVYVSSVNLGFSALRYIQCLRTKTVRQIHLAGHSQDPTRGLIDTHDAPVCEAVWSLYRESIAHHGMAATMVEWDANIPDFRTLEDEAMKVLSIQSEFNGKNDGKHIRAQLT